MVRKNGWVPQHCRHAGRNLGYVKLGGRVFYTGRWGTPEAEREYERLLAEWLANGRTIEREPESAREDEYRIEDLVADYWLFAERYYRKNGEPTGEITNIRYALKPLVALYARTAARTFGPLAYRALQEHLARQGHLCRTQVNKRLGIVKRAFRWAVSMERLDASVLHALQSVPGLKRGRTIARETGPVRPVADADFDAALVHVSPEVEAMARIQFLTGMRPGEVVQLRTSDVDRSSDVWIYRPAVHKTEHHERERIVAIGPRAQALLSPFLKLDDHNAYVFTPGEAECRRRMRRRAVRVTKTTPSQEHRDARCVAHPKRTFEERYSVTTYRRAIARGCARAGTAPWSPNRIRHTAATRIRRAYGLDAAQVVLGHANAEVTEVYAAANTARAIEVMGALG